MIEREREKERERKVTCLLSHVDQFFSSTFEAETPSLLFHFELNRKIELLESSILHRKCLSAVSQTIRFQLDSFSPFVVGTIERSL